MTDTSRAMRHIIRTQEPGIDGTGITTAEKVQLVTDVSATKATTDVLAALRFDPAHPNYGAIRDDSSPSARSTNDTAFALAAQDAFTAGGTLVIKGTYHLASQLQVLCNVDAAGGVLRFNDLSLSPALLVGGPTVAERLTSRTISLPEVWQDAKTGTGWAGTDTGVEVCRANQCIISIPHITNFSTNLAVTGASGGNAYNTYAIGILENGKINLDLYCRDAGGWVNENLFLGGRFHHNTDEGVSIAGVRQIRLRNEAYPVNNNVFLKPSIEGNTAEYHVEVAGPYNAFHHARWEASPPKMLLNGTNAHATLVFYGYNAQSIQFTYINGANAGYLHWYSRTRMQLTGEVELTNHGGGAFPALAVNDTAGRRVEIAGNATTFKRPTDTAPRVKINHSTAGIYLGNGVAEPEAGVVGYGVGGLRFTGTRFGFYGVTPVDQPAANPDTSGATLAQLETEVNQLKAALRALGLIAT